MSSISRVYGPIGSIHAVKNTATFSHLRAGRRPPPASSRRSGGGRHAPPEEHPPEQPVLSHELVIERREQVQNDQANKERRDDAVRRKGRIDQEARRQGIAPAA